MNLHNKFLSFSIDYLILIVLDYNEENRVLITIGLDEDTPCSRIKFWDLSEWDLEGYPYLFHESTLQTALAV
jgi:hypothetical protein